MGHQIIKQPNGKFAVFSSIVDDFIMYEATREDIIELELEDSKERITREVDRVLEELKSTNPRPYYQFTRTWEDALQTIKEVHGKKHVKQILDSLDKE